MLKLIYIVIGIGALSASLVTARLAVQHTDRQSGDRTERTFDLSVLASGSTGLDIHAPIAKIDLETGNYSEVSVHAVRWTKTPETAAGKRWMNEAHLTLTQSGDGVYLKDDFKSNNMHGDGGNFNGGLELQIKAPTSMNLKVKLGVGSVKPHGNLRAVDIQVGAGAVEGQFRIAGSSDVHVGAGEVKLDLPRSENLDVDAHTGVGTIEGLPGHKERSGGIHVGEARMGRFGSGGSTLSIHVGAGNISISGSDAKPLESSEVSDSGSRDLKLWSGDSDSDDSGDVSGIVSNALAMSDGVIAQTKGRKHGDDDDDLSDIGPVIEESMKGIGPILDKTLSQIGPDIDRAMRDVQPELDRDLANIGPDIDKAMRQVKPDMDRDMKDIGPEIEKAMKQIRPEIERARREARMQLDKEMPEMERAMKQAQAEIDKAVRDMDRSHSDDKELDESVRRSVRESLKAAREAIRQSMAAARKAIAEAKRNIDKDRD